MARSPARRCAATIKLALAALPAPCRLLKAAPPSSQFWDTKDPDQKPFSYQAGVGGVITGWDQGCLGMKMGEIRKLEIPGNEGYGAKGFPAWGITPNATLNFTLERLK